MLQDNLKLSGKKRNRNQYRKIRKRKRGLIKSFILLTLLSLTTFFSASYIHKLQLTTMTDADYVEVVKGYYLIRDFEELIRMEPENNEEKLNKISQIRDISTKMASYAIKRADSVNSEEGQLFLNRYYVGIKELGMNISTQVSSIYDEPILLEGFLNDVSGIKIFEKKAFGYYDFDQTIFKEKKGNY